MTDELIKRLRCTTRFDGGIKQFLDERQEAADELSRLYDEVEGLKGKEEGLQSEGVSPLATGLSSDDGAASVSTLRASIPDAVLIEVERNAEGEVLICTGCGTVETIRSIRERHATAFTCCPERKMVRAADFGYPQGLIPVAKAGGKA